MKCNGTMIFDNEIVHCEREKGHLGRCQKTGDAGYLAYEKIPYTLEWRHVIDKKLKKKIEAL